ncbi:MAG: helix-turn-helix transcriptional regulator [Ruminococcaceae bacterium]|nr:helix-turn-helix transcriptional regulator [Oscillospiraceae bacterium]
MEQKVKQDVRIGDNIRRIRRQKGLGQTDLVRLLQIGGCDMTRECLVKIERCTQHVQASQLRAIRDVLETTYDALLDGEE